MNQKLIPVSLALLAAGFAGSAHAQTGAVYAYLSAPNLQTAYASIPGTSTETFESLPTGNQTSYTSTALSGTYTGTFAVVADDQYGTGTGNYFSLGAQSGTSTPVTLNFSTPVTYFGLAYNAGDVNNGFTFYDASGNSLGRYSTATLMSALNGGAGTVTALDGSVYNTAQYFGKPNGGGPTVANTGLDGNEPFSFLNFFPTAGTTIKSIVFDNSDSVATGFESDNHTITTDATVVPPTNGKFVPIGSTKTPDASPLALLTVGLPMVGGIVARRRRK